MLGCSSAVCVGRSALVQKTIRLSTLHYSQGWAFLTASEMKGGACQNTGLSPRATAAIAVASPGPDTSTRTRPRSGQALLAFTAPPDPLLTRPEMLNLCTWLRGLKSCQEEAIPGTGTLQTVMCLEPCLLPSY